jgi:hypothetical protein
MGAIRDEVPFHCLFQAGLHQLNCRYPVIGFF